jgi:hypothetical protein
LAAQQSDKELQVYISQYEQCWEDKRALEAMIWQTPAVFLAIDAVLLAGLISQGFPSVGGSGSAHTAKLVAYCVALLLAFFVSLVGTVQISKHRLFAIARVDDLRSIEYNFRTVAGVDAHLVQFITREIKQDPRYEKMINLINNQSAYDWLFALCCGVTILLYLGTVLWLIALWLGWVW